MSTAFFRTPERIAQLLSTAALWKDTPWSANAEARGKHGGVSCHNLPRAIYIACSAFHESFPRIIESPNNACIKNIMEPFVDGRPEFERVSHKKLSDLKPGDLLGLWLARDINGNRVRHNHTNHFGICLPNGDFIQVMMHKCCSVDSYNTPPWQQRIRAAWRPLEN